MGLDLKKLEKRLEESIKNGDFDKWFKKKEERLAVRENQLKRFCERILSDKQFSEIVEKVIAKYSTDNYVFRWINRGIEPQEKLFFFLFDYAKKYGRQCNEAEWENYGNMFTSELHYARGYFFNKMNGQGTAIEITKAKRLSTVFDGIDKELKKIIKKKQYL